MNYITGARNGSRTVYRFTQNWRVAQQDHTGYADSIVNEEDWVPVHLPHTNITLPHKDFSPDTTRFVSWYRKSFRVPSDVQNKRVKLFFDGVMTVADVYINGIYQGRHKGGFTPFCFDVTDALRLDGENIVSVRVDSTRRKDVPPEGHVVDYLVFGGIYRNVYLIVQDLISIDDVFLRTVELTPEQAKVAATAKIDNCSTENQSVALELTLTSPSGKQHVAKAVTNVQAYAQTYATIEFTIVDPEVWHVDTPSLYDVVVKLNTENGLALDDDVFRFGIRTVGLSVDGLVLNGELIKLRGLNRHQSFPYIGGAAPERLQRKDAEILKRDLGLNYVRTSHYPQDPAFLDACDELGLLVFTELPGWQHIGDEDWQQVAKTHVEEMVKRDRNRACIFMWGTRINESQDHHDFYTDTGRIARTLDPTRPIGGVRNFRQSEWLEDVFTLNDFSMGVMPTTHAPQLITEFLGHMYPTKKSDQEVRLARHAEYHARIVDEVYQRQDIIGSSGWCAFDYNTNESFGPGDMICYHGVMDIFRLPKFAAQFYKSQQRPTEQVVLEPATYFTFETADHSELIKAVDVSKMESITHSDAYMAPVYVYSNCDEIEVFVNGESIGRLSPEIDEFAGLPYPPFRVDLRGYGIYGTLDFVGYIQGCEVARKQVTTPMGIESIDVQADDVTLFADGSDMTRLVIRALDKNGTQCPYANRVVSFSVEGPGELVGENPIALEGGQTAVYVRAGITAGKVRVHVHSTGLKTTDVSIVIQNSNITNC